MSEIERLKEEGVARFHLGSTWPLDFFALLAVHTYEATADPDLRQMGLKPLIMFMPETFASQAAADGWISGAFLFSTIPGPPEIPPDLTDQIATLARGRVRAPEQPETEASPPESTQMPSVEQKPEPVQEPQTESAQPEPPEPDRREGPTGFPVWDYLLAAGAAGLGAGGWLWARRGA